MSSSPVFANNTTSIPTSSNKFSTTDKYSYNNYSSELDRQTKLKNQEVPTYTLPSIQEIIEDNSFDVKSVNVAPSVNGNFSSLIRGSYQNAENLEQLKSWEMASIVSQVAGVDINFAHDNMTSIINAYTGRDIENEGGVSGWFSGLGKVALSKVTSTLAGLNAKVLNASLIGKSDEEKQRSIDYFVNNELPQLTTYYNPDMYGFRDNVISKVLYFTAENSPDLLESLITGVLTGGIGSITGASQKLIKAVDWAVRIASVYEKESGSALLNFWQTYNANGQRIDYETASVYSSLVGIVNTVAEFGLEAGLDKLGVKTVQSLTRADRFFNKGFKNISSQKIQEAAVQTLGEYLKKGTLANLKNATGEGITEAVQTFSEDFFSNLAYKVSDGFGDYVKSNKEILSEMAEVFALTTASTFLTAPIIGGDDNAFTYFGYLKDMKNGKLVKLNQAQQYSVQGQTGQLISMNNISQTSVEKNYNASKEKDVSVTPQGVNVYKFGNTYIPATQSDALQVAKARGNTTGIYVNVIQGKDVDAQIASFDSLSKIRELGINTSDITGFTNDTVVVPADQISSFTAKLMANSDVVSVVTKKDGEAVNGGSFDEATLYIRNSNGDTVKFNITTEANATKNNLTLSDMEDINDKANAQIKEEYIAKSNDVVQERVTQSKKILNQKNEKGIDKVFNERIGKLSKKEKNDTKTVRDVLYNALYRKDNENSFSRKTAKAIASVNASLLQIFAKINNTDIRTYVKDVLGVDLETFEQDGTVKPFINFMTKADMEQQGTPAFIVRQPDGTFTVNLFAGVGTAENTENNLSHEFGHMFLTTIKDDSVLDDFKKLYKQEYEEGGILGQAFQERFCTDLETYIASGKAKSIEQRNVFELIVGAMKDFFEYIKAIDFENKADVIQAFDKLFDETAIENRQRASYVENTFNSLTSQLATVKEKVKDATETIDSLVSDFETQMQLIQESTDEDTSSMWQDLKETAKELRKELSSISETDNFNGDSDISSLIDSLSDKNLKELMNNRPIASQQSQPSQTNASRYNKKVKVDNENRAKLEFKGKELISSDVSVSDGLRVVQFLQSSPQDISNDTTTKEKAKEVYKNIGTVTNSQTGDNVQFVNSVFGKIARHKEYDPRLIGQLATLFENATFLFDEKADFETPRFDGTKHKNKNNVVSFSNYGAKIRIDGEEYIVRYSVQNMRNKKGAIGGRQFHSQQLSSIKIISDPTNLTASLMRGEEGIASDYKLASFFKAVKKKVESSGLRFNKLVNHGSGAEFDHFDVEHYGFTGSGGMSEGWGSYFAETQEVSEGYSRAKLNSNKRYNMALEDINYCIEAQRILEEEYSTVAETVVKKRQEGERSLGEEFRLADIQERLASVDARVVRERVAIIAKKPEGKIFARENSDFEIYVMAKENYDRTIARATKASLIIEVCEDLLQKINQGIYSYDKNGIEATNNEIMNDYEMRSEELPRIVLLDRYGTWAKDIDLKNKLENVIENEKNDLKIFGDLDGGKIAAYFREYEKRDNILKEEFGESYSMIEALYTGELKPEVGAVPQRAFIYKVNIPDENYLDFDKTKEELFDYSMVESGRIVFNSTEGEERFRKLYQKIYDEFSLNLNLNRSYAQEIAYDVLTYNHDFFYNEYSGGSDLYWAIEEAFEKYAGLSDIEALKRTSKLLSEAGYTGNMYKSVHSKQQNYVVYLDNDAEIVDMREFFGKHIEFDPTKVKKKVPVKYQKNVDTAYTYSQGSILVPYTPAQIANRIKLGMPVEASHLQTLLETHKDDKNFSQKYKTAIENELIAIRTLTANPVLNRTILDEYNKMLSEKGEKGIDKKVLYNNVTAEMEKIDKSFSFGNQDKGIALINRAIAHAGWETTETRNASFLAEHQSKESINELARYYSDNGYLSNEFKFYPLENLRMLALNLEYGYGKITDKTYEKIRQELADPMFTTALRIASTGKISYEDANNVYHNSSVEINNEDFAQTIHDSSLPEGWRKALKTGAYTDTLLQEMNDYVLKQEITEAEQEQKITDLTESEKQLKKDIRTIESMYTKDINSANKTVLRANDTIQKLNEKLEQLNADYKAKKIEAKEYQRSAKRLENALERVKNTNAIMKAKMIKERVQRTMDEEIVLNRKTQDHATGRRMESLYHDLNLYQSTIDYANANGDKLELTADFKDIKKDYPKIVTFLQYVGLLDNDGYITGNIKSLSLEDTRTLYDLFRAYKAEARRVLKKREQTKKDSASYDAHEIRKDMTVKNQWKLSEEEEAEVTNNVDKMVDDWVASEKDKGHALSQEEIEEFRENARIGAIAERELGKGTQDSRPANAEYNKSLKESKVKTTNRMFQIPRYVLRKINPTLERIIMGGYDADGNETVGIEQLTSKEEKSIRKRSEGFQNTVLNLFGDKLKKGHKEKGLVSKWDMFNIFSSDKSTLKDSDIEIFYKDEGEEGGITYEPTSKFAELIKQAKDEGDKNKVATLENIYKVAVMQDETGFDSGAEHYNYTLEEKMGIYLMLKQEGYVYALWKGNNISASRMLAIYEEFTNADQDSNIGRAKQLADYLQKDAESKYPEINPISIKLDNKDMSDIKVMDYFGIFYDLDSSYDGLDISLNGDGQRPSTFTLADGFLHDREGGTKALRLDILSTWAKQVQRQEHYIAFAEYFDHIRRIMNDDNIYNDIKNQNGIEVAKYVQNFLRNIAKSNSSLVGVDETVGRVFKSMRSALAKSALSWNIAPVASQITTLTYGFSEGIPFSDMFGAMKYVLAHPKKSAEFVNSLSEQMKAQKRIDIAIARTNDIDLTTKAGKAQYYIDLVAETGMKPLEFVDTMVKNILWIAKYNQQLAYYKNLEKTDASIGKQAENDSDYSTKRAVYDANVFVLDSQQSTMAKNNPLIYSTNNDLARSALMFSSQSTKQAFWHLNNLSEAEQGKRLLTYARNIVGYSMAVALTCAISGRITKDEDEGWDEWWLKVMREMGGEVLTEVPVIGQLISQYDNGWNSSVTVPIGNVAQQGYNLLSKLTEEEKANGKSRWEKAGTALKNLAMESIAITGLPEAQLKKLYNALAERNFLYALGYDWGEWLDDLRD